MSATVLTNSSFQKLSTSSSCHLSSSPLLGGQPLSSDLGLKFPRNGSPLLFARNTLKCNSILPTNPADLEQSKGVLDAFFLGKAFAEVVNERAESALGEFLSSIGRIQAEQQKHVEEFQEEVVERAKRAQVKAAQEAMGQVVTSTAKSVTSNSMGNSTTPSDIIGSSISVVTDPLVAMMTED